MSRSSPSAQWPVLSAASNVTARWRSIQTQSLLRPVIIVSTHFCRSCPMQRLSIALLVLLTSSAAAADWPQLQGDALRSGNAPQAVLPAKLDLVGAIPLRDAIQAAPVVASGRVFVIDGSGLV